MVHVHIRDDEHRPTLDGQRLEDTVTALRESTDLVVQLSTGGSVHDPLDDRLKVLDARAGLVQPDMGTTNFGDDVFLNPWPFVCELYQLSQEREVVPEFELFDLGQAAALHRLLATYGLPYGGKVHVDLVMGVPGGMPGTTDALVAAVAALPEGDQLVGHRDRPLDPRRWRWPPCPRAVTCASGMEDVLTLSRGVPVEHNEQLVSRAAELGAWPSARR